MIAIPLRDDAPSLFSIEAEQQVLGTLLIDQRGLPAISGAGGRELFFDPVHADIYDTIARKYAAGELVSPVTLKDALADRLTDLGGPAYLVRLTGVAQIAQAMPGYAKSLGEMAHKRRIQSALSEAQAALARGDSTGAEIAAALESRLISFEGAGQTIRPVSMMAAVNAAVAQMQAAVAGEDAGGVASGIAALDRIIPAFFPGELTLIGARPSMGKTAVALAIALNAARASHGVAIASLEMTPDAMAARALAEATSFIGNAVPYTSMRRGDLSRGQYDAVIEEARHVAELPITFLPRGYSDIGALVAGTRQIMRSTENTANPLRLLIVDYAQLLRAPGKDRYQQITEISMTLKALAVQMNIPVIALSQLSRQLESREDKRPIMSDLRESGQLEQDADNVIFCYRPAYYIERLRPDPEDPPEDHQEWQDKMKAKEFDLELIVAKQRQGTIGTAHVKFAAAVNRIWCEGQP